jgi:hypothetical protein
VAQAASVSGQKKPYLGKAAEASPFFCYPRPSSWRLLVCRQSDNTGTNWLTMKKSSFEYGHSRMGFPPRSLMGSAPIATMASRAVINAVITRRRNLLLCLGECLLMMTRPVLCSLPLPSACGVFM